MLTSMIFLNLVEKNTQIFKFHILGTTSNWKSIQSWKLFNNFLIRCYHWEKKNWQQSTGIAKRSILVTTCSETQRFSEFISSTTRRSQRKPKQEWLRSCPRNIAGQRVKFQGLRQNWMSFIWTHEFGCNREPLWEHPGFMTGKTRNLLRASFERNFILMSVLRLGGSFTLFTRA